MSGQPCIKPSDADAYRKAYLDTLAVMVANDDMNYQANKLHQRTGQVATQITDYRSTAEKMADITSQRVLVKAELRRLMDEPNTERTINHMSDDEVLFVAQSIEAIAKELLPKYKQGVESVVFLDYVKSLMKKPALALAGASRESAGPAVLDVPRLDEDELRETEAILDDLGGRLDRFNISERTAEKVGLVEDGMRQQYAKIVHILDLLPAVNALSPSVRDTATRLIRQSIVNFPSSEQLIQLARQLQGGGGEQRTFELLDRLSQLVAVRDEDDDVLRRAEIMVRGQDELYRLAGENRNLGSRLESEEITRRQAEDEIQRLQDLTRFEEQKGTIRADTIRKREARIEELRGQLRQLEGQVGQLQGQVGRLKEGIRNERASRTSVQELYRESLRDKADAEAEILRLRQEQEQLMVRLASEVSGGLRAVALQRKLDENERYLDILTERFSEAKETLEMGQEELRGNIERFKSNQRTLEGMNARLVQLKQEAEARVADLEREVQQHPELREKLREARIELKMILDELDQEHRERQEAVASELAPPNPLFREYVGQGDKFARKSNALAQLKAYMDKGFELTTATAPEFLVREGATPGKIREGVNGRAVANIYDENYDRMYVFYDSRQLPLPPSPALARADAYHRATYSEGVRPRARSRSESGESYHSSTASPLASTAMTDPEFPSAGSYLSPPSRVPKGRGLQGRGLAVVQEGVPHKKVAPFGRYLIHLSKLNEDVICLSTKQGTNVPSYRTLRVSVPVANIIRKMVNGRNPSYEDIHKLGEDDKAEIHKVFKKAHIVMGEGLEIPKPTNLVEDMNRFTILKGEILAGNDGTETIKQFKLLVLKLMNGGHLPRGQAKELLVDLANLGY